MEYKVKDLVNINSNSLKKNDFEKEESIKYLDTANITKGTIDKISELNFGKDEIPSRARRKVKADDIIISTVRPNQEHYGIIDESIEDIIVSTGFAVLSPNNDRVDPYYLYLKMTSKETTRKLQMIAEDSTSAYPSIKPSVLGEVSLNLPNLMMQNTISKFIKSIDKKIEVNTKTIANLEELSQTIFKRWFIDFEFPNENGNPYKSSGGQIACNDKFTLPKGWSKGTIKDIADIVMGQSPKSDTYNNENIGYPLINGASDFNNGTIDPNKYTSDPRKIGHLNSYVFGVRATIGRVTTLDKSYAIGRGAGIATAKDNNFTEFLYFILKKAFIDFESTTSGSVYLNVSRKDIESYNIITPSRNIINIFHDKTQHLLKQVSNYRKENRNLSDLRDTLLPKLMSGELELPEALEV